MRLIDLYPVLPETIQLRINGKTIWIDRDYDMVKYRDYEALKVHKHQVLDAWVITVKGR